LEDLERVAKEIGEDISQKELLEMMDEADRDGDRAISRKDFIYVMKKTNLF